MPAAPAAPPTAAPAPAPAPAAAPAPKPAPAPAPAAAKPAPAATKPSPATIQSGYDELDKLLETPVTQPKPKTATEKPPTTEKETNENEPNPPPTEEKTSADVPPEKMAPKQLREAYSAAKKRLAELEAKTKEFETRTNTDAETQIKTFEQKLAEREKRLAEVEKELEATAFEKSDTFKNEFEKPYHSAWNLGRSYVSSLKVTDIESGEPRQGTPQDFDMLMQLSNQDPDKAAELADQLFGSKVAMVAPYMARVNESLARMQEVLHERREAGSAKEKERTERMTKQREEIGKHVKTAWTKHQAGALEKYPQWFKPVDGDDEGNALLEKGFQQSAQAFAKLNAVSDPSLSPEERESVIASHAAVFNKAAAFPRLVHQLKAKETRIQELEQELKQFKESGPGAGEGGGKNGRNAAGAVPNWEAQLESRAR